VDWEKARKTEFRAKMAKKQLKMRLFCRRLGRILKEIIKNYTKKAKNGILNHRKLVIVIGNLI
jgi:hypothetical protein